jgi:uncharacterized membrane protein YkgB
VRYIAAATVLHTYIYKNKKEYQQKTREYKKKEKTEKLKRGRIDIIAY